MRRVLLFAAVMALGMGASLSCNLKKSAHNLSLGSQDKAAEKEDCDAAVTIKNGYGQDCEFTREQAGDPGRTPPTCTTR
jgi:hypothetical protein